jgi:hypothetical protein
MKLADKYALKEWPILDEESEGTYERMEWYPLNYRDLIAKSFAAGRQSAIDDLRSKGYLWYDSSCDSESCRQSRMSPDNWADWLESENND